MLEQIIKNTAVKNKFLIYWLENDREIQNSRIIIDFNPLVNYLQDRLHKLNNETNFCLLHYQAKPVGLRKFGVLYQSNYFSVSEIQSKVQSQTIIIPERIGMLPPNSAICYLDCKFEKDLNRDIGFINPIK